MEYSDDDDSIEPQAKATKQRKARKPKKDPNKPKKNMNAFFIYSNANRERLKAENPDAKFTELGGIASAEFKALSDSEKAKYDRLAAAEKERYLAEMEDYEPPEEDGGGPAKKKKKDPNAPKRNMNAYFIYSNANRDRLKAENPDAKFTDLSKFASVEFKALSEKDKAKWDKLAAADKERYLAEMETYSHAN